MFLIFFQRRVVEFRGNRDHPEEAVIMSRSDPRTLIARGRKAGLRTDELYAALSSRMPEGGESRPGQADGNGFVADYDREGHCVYRPSAESERS
jgi:hypothetical protein